MFSKSTPSARRKARQLALQGIYQWQMTQALPAHIEVQLLESRPSKKTDVAYFSELLKGVSEHSVALDAKIQPSLDRSIEEVNPVERAILRIAAYEFVYRIDVPYRVVIDEALRLGKTFGALDGFKYINGVLDSVARVVRATECQAQKRS